jgi:hypothetical protein
MVWLFAGCELAWHGPLIGVSYKCGAITPRRQPCALRLREAAAPSQGIPQLTQFRRFAEEEVHVRGEIAFRRKPLAPAGQQDHGSGRRRGFYKTRHLPAVDVRHAKISHHGVECLLALE